MKETPILYKADMVRAYFAGYKTETRRLQGLEAVNGVPDAWEYIGRTESGLYIFDNRYFKGKRIETKCPFGGKGDALWGRETWAPSFHGLDCLYRADEIDSELFPVNKWKSARFMPRYASRIYQPLTADPIPQRLWDMTEAEAIAEGIEGIFQYPDEITNKALRNVGAKEVTKPYLIGYRNYLYREDRRFHYYNLHSPDMFEGDKAAIASYRSLWDSIYAPKGYPYSGNWWVWPLKFERYSK